VSLSSVWPGWNGHPWFLMSPRVHALGLRSMGAGHDVRLDHMRHILLTWNPGPDNNEQWSPEEWRIKMVEGTSEGRTYGRGQRQCQTRDPTYAVRQPAGPVRLHRRTPATAAAPSPARTAWRPNRRSRPAGAGAGHRVPDPRRRAAARSPPRLDPRGTPATRPPPPTAVRRPPAGLVRPRRPPPPPRSPPHAAPPEHARPPRRPPRRQPGGRAEQQTHPAPQRDGMRRDGGQAQPGPGGRGRGD